MADTDLILSLINSVNEQRALKLVALEKAGAITPAAARRFEELGVTAGDVWAQLVREGRIREASPGTFYLFELPRANRRERLIKMTVFYLLILAIPIVLILLNRAQH